MGLLDYYRQFEDMTEEEVNSVLRERRAREKTLALEQIPSLDLSRTEWPDYPDAEVMNQAIFAARRSVNGYPDRDAVRVRRRLAERHGVLPEQIAFGNGSTELLQAAALRLLSPGQELVTPWPSYPLYPLMASHAGARPVAVGLSGGRVDPDRVRAAVGADTRVLALANPNDPTGTYLPSRALGELIASLPEHVHVLLDEAYVQFQTVEPPDSALALIDAFPRLIVFRTFSKVYGLAGLRAGYAVGAPDAIPLLRSLAPVLGVNALTQAGVDQALKIGDPEVARRRAVVVEQRARLLGALHDMPVDAPDSQANFVWLRTAGMDGAQLTAALESEGVVVAPGAALGDDDHVRASIRGAAATERLLSALRRALAD